jgi:hypothetical protein
VTEPTEKRVTWAELFFDLVLVFAITRIATLLHADHSWTGVGLALIVFVPTYWAWVGTSVHANLHDTDNTVDRAGILTLALCALFMAVALPDAYGEDGSALRRCLLRTPGDPGRPLLQGSADHVGDAVGRGVCERTADALRRLASQRPRGPSCGDSRPWSTWPRRGSCAPG